MLFASPDGNYAGSASLREKSLSRQISSRTGNVTWGIIKGCGFPQAGLERGLWPWEGSRLRYKIIKQRTMTILGDIVKDCSIIELDWKVQISSFDAHSRNYQALRFIPTATRRDDGQLP